MTIEKDISKFVGLGDIGVHAMCPWEEYASLVLAVCSLSDAEKAKLNKKISAARLELSKEFGDIGLVILTRTEDEFEVLWTDEEFETVPAFTLKVD